MRKKMFRASNNQAEYDALMVGIQLAKELEARMLMVKSDSQVDLQLTRYLDVVKEQTETLEGFTLLHYPKGRTPYDCNPRGIRSSHHRRDGERAIKEVHEGACGSHIGGRALASKLARVGFYWPTIKKDSLAFVKKCDKCQHNVN
ncbi:hypothetical protein CR513_30483, partial [Mucuna pruriens]